MIYVLLSAFIISIYSLCYKFAHRRGCSPEAVNASMLVVGAVLGLLYALTTANLKAVPPLVIVLGLLSGFCSFAAVASFFVVARRGNLSVSWTVIALAIVLPLIASVILWQESPSFRQILGIIGTSAALVLLGADQGRRSSTRLDFKTRREFWVWMGMLAVAFLTTGLVMVWSKALLEKELGGYIVQFMFICYLAGAVCAILFLWVKKVFPRRADIEIGSIMGLTGFFSFVLFLHALEILPGVVAFPMRSIVNIALTTVFSIVLLRERIGPAGWAGLTVAGGAIFLMC